MQEFSLLVDMEQVILSALQKSSTPKLAVAVKLVTYQWQQMMLVYAEMLSVVEKGQLHLAMILTV